MSATMHNARERHGFALPTTIIALVLLSALVAGALFVSTEELRSGRGDLADQRALAAAEWALARAVTAWDPLRNTRDSVGQAAILGDSAWTPNDRVVVTSTRVQRRSVWMTAEATSGGDGRAARARHAVAASLRLVGADVPDVAALTALGGVAVTRAVVDGRGAAGVPDASRVCAEDDPAPVAGIVVADVTRVTCTDCAELMGTGVFGTPPVDSSLAARRDSTVTRVGRELVAGAAVDVPGGSLLSRPVVVNGGCDRGSPLNWGDPGGGSACADYYPIVHVRGDATLATGAVGQGVLVVNGSLRVEPNARFVGIVLVTGDVTVAGVGAEIVGAVFADDGGGAGVSTVSDGGAIRFSRCAVHRATLGSAHLARTPVRWWVELR